MIIPNLNSTVAKKSAVNSQAFILHTFFKSPTVCQRYAVYVVPPTMEWPVGPDPVALLKIASIPTGFASCCSCPLILRSSYLIFHVMFSAKSVSYRSFLGNVKEVKQNFKFTFFFENW